MEIIEGEVNQGDEDGYLDGWTNEILAEVIKSLENIDLDYEFIIFFKDYMLNDLNAVQAEFVSKQKYLNFQQSYMETQKKNQVQAKALEDRCEALEKNLVSLYSAKSALLEKKVKISKNLEEKKTFFYSALKKEFNTKALLENINTKIADVSQKQGQIINEIRDDQLNTIDHSTFVNNQILTPKVSKASPVRPKRLSKIPLILTILLLILLHIIY